MRPTADPRVEALANFATTTTRRAVQSSRTAEAFVKLLKKLHASSCSGAPDTACQRCVEGKIATALISELIPIQKLIDEMSVESKARLAKAGREYLRRRESAPKKQADGSSHRCPFLVDGKCLLREVKPFSAFFGPDLEDSGSALAFELGHAVGLCAEGLGHHRVELGLIVGQLLESSGWIDSYLSGMHVFWEEGRFPAIRDPIIEATKELLGVREPSGAPEFDPLVSKAEKLESELGVDEALVGLPHSTVLQRVAHLRIPNELRSEDDIELYRNRFLAGLRRYIKRENDPSDVFDALRHFHLFPLAYHGREVKSILKELGETLFAPAAARALPDLVTPIDKRKRSGRIRVGYISSNLRMHNGGFWSLGWIQNHGEDIESFVFVLNEDPDASTRLFRKAADHYYVLPGDVPSTARFIKSLELDLLIFTDLGMDMLNNLYGSLRLAPVQATAWGHPVTSGLPSIDYYLSSDWMEPEGAEDHYTEKLVRLPESGLFIRRTWPSVSQLSRSDFGIGEGVLALVPQNPMKLLPREDVLFARISEGFGVPLVFVEGQVASTNRETRLRLERSGIQAHWVPFQKHKDFLRLLDLADVIVDVPAWNGGNTTLHALSYGKPVVTLSGEFMRGRHCLAFLRQAKMESLVARDQDDFVRLALDRETHQRAVKAADFGGPFECKSAVNGLDEWIRQTCKL